jgi:hypothetical protein
MGKIISILYYGQHYQEQMLESDAGGRDHPVCRRRGLVLRFLDCGVNDENELKEQGKRYVPHRSG